MPAAEIAFIAKVREQIEFLQHEEYSYDQLRVYVSGIARPWVFGPADEFEFDGDEVLCRLAVYALVLGTGKKLFSDGFGARQTHPGRDPCSAIRGPGQHLPPLRRG